MKIESNKTIKENKEGKIEKDRKTIVIGKITERINKVNEVGKRDERKEGDL